jgi:hypothetical protein
MAFFQRSSQVSDDMVYVEEFDALHISLVAHGTDKYPGQ